MDGLGSVRWLDVVDVALVTALFWTAIVWLRRTRARLALLGIAIVAAVYALARLLGLPLIAWILQGFFAVSVIVLVVVFQEDLRRLFEQIAVWGLRRRASPAPLGVVDALIRAVSRLAQARTGALIVLPGREPLDRHLDGGVPLDGLVSEPLLLSLFDPHSPGHDGAAVIAGDRLRRFGAHLPLSHDHAQLRWGGTRHAAALGLAERTDALCVVVSEERGTVSVARAGQLRTLSRPRELAEELRRFRAETAAPEPTAGPAWRRVGRHWLEGTAALALAVLCWFLFVPGSTPVVMTRKVRVEVSNLPPGYELESVDPPEVRVTFSGRRRDLYLMGADDVQLEIDALLVQLGRRTFRVSPDQVQHPDAVTVRAVSPTKVRLSVRRRAQSPAP